MTPTIQTGELYLVFPLERLFRQPQRDDIVYFRPPPHPDTTRISLLGITYQPITVKRIVALQGDVLSYQGGQRFIDNTHTPDPLASETALVNNIALNIPQIQLASNEVYVLGDNRFPLQSVDSRHFGAIKLGRIQGRLRVRLWPLSF